MISYDVLTIGILVATIMIVATGFPWLLVLMFIRPWAGERRPYRGRHHQ